jgi:hypothetical protein
MMISHYSHRSVLGFVALLLSYVWRFRHAIAGASVKQGDSMMRMLIIATMHAFTNATDSSDGSQSGAGILYFPWVSRILVFAVFVIALAHFALNAVFFTRLGLPNPTADLELGNHAGVGPQVDNAPDNAGQGNGGAAIPGVVQAIPPGNHAT